MNTSVGHDFFILIVRQDRDLNLEKMIRANPLYDGLHGSTGLGVWIRTLAARPKPLKPSPQVLDPSWRKALDSIPDAFERKVQKIESFDEDED